MNEIKTLNGYAIADATARELIAQLSKEIEQIKQNSMLDNEFEMLGKTPMVLPRSGTVRLQCEGECAYKITSDTIAILDIMNGSLTDAIVEKRDGYYRLTTDGTTDAWYRSFIVIPVDGLTIGEAYHFVFDAAGMLWDPDNHITAGHWILKDGNGDTILSKNNKDSVSKQVHEFTATTSNLSLYWYPSTGYTFASGIQDVACVREIYINRLGTDKLSMPVNVSGSFVGTTVLMGLSNGVRIETIPACFVYYKALSVEIAPALKGRHAGKTCVCFGDSVTGNMMPPYDYPSVIANETGMNVINAGFGGCRMSDTHQTASYAAFSMVKLAEAVASGDWSLQDEYVGALSRSVHGQDHLAELKSLNWEAVDFMTIAYGTNDIQSSVIVDNMMNPQDTKTYLGALRYAIEKIWGAYPHIKMLLLTPIYRYWNDEAIDSDEKMFNGGTYRFTEWGDGLLRVAEEYKIPALDMYRKLGFNAVTRSFYFAENDGTHPNANGLKAMGGKIAARLLAEY